MRNRNSGFTLIELLIVVAIIGILATIAIPMLLNALDRARQTTTVNRIAAIGGFVEIYIMDFNEVGAPKIGNDIEALDQLFQTLEINNYSSITTDGWNNDIIVSVDAGMAQRGYTLMSYGSDSAEGPVPATPGTVSLFPEDIIWKNGKFTQQPRGNQQSQ